MYLTGKRYDKIERVVLDLFSSLKIDSFPLDCFEICRHLNIEVVPYSCLSAHKQSTLFSISEDGFSVLKQEADDKKHWIIYYNDAKPAERIRFTVMHELGHITLDHSEHSDLAESEANYDCFTELKRQGVTVLAYPSKTNKSFARRKDE